ncbi:hypothetical protein K501DRAFT_216489 [Backusella circina FSU 941]|nr:hypothetical protein K501DRAFT_216489 [Backusella circina FSU 941]
MIQLIHTTNTQEIWAKLAFQSQTDFIFVFDRQVVPGRSYFDFILRLLHTPAFHSSLLESAPVCKDDAENNNISFYSSINNVLVLRRTWISSLIPSLLFQNNTVELSSSIQTQASYISQTLDIPIITIPVSEKDLYANTSKESCVDSNESISQIDVLFIVDKGDDSLVQLACQFDPTISINMVTLNRSFAENPCENKKIQFHPINKSSKEESMIELEYWIKRHPPSVIIKMEKNKQSLLNLVVNRFTSVTKINIPTAQDISLVSWMADLPLSSLQQWNIPKIKLVVTGGGNKNGGNLQKMLESANKAYYLGDDVDISIVLDEKSGKSIRNSAEQLAWQNGRKEIRHRISGVEPMQVFVESWYPNSNHEYAILLDERVELSNVFYAWLKYSLLKYRYGDSVSNSIFGISLNTPRVLDTDPTQRRLFQPTFALHEHGYDGNSPILIQAPNNFGTLYFPEHWKEFHDYITARLTDQGIANKKKKIKHLLKDYVLTEARSNKWLYSWRKYFDEMMYMRGYVIMCPNNKNGGFSSLSHVLSSRSKMEKYPQVEELFKVPLLADQLPKIQLPKLDELPVFDLWGRISNMNDILKKGHKLQRKFSACEPLLPAQHKHDASDMLCPFSQMTEIPIEVDPDTLPTLTVPIPRTTLI